MHNNEKAEIKTMKSSNFRQPTQSRKINRGKTMNSIEMKNGQLWRQMIHAKLIYAATQNDK